MKLLLTILLLLVASLGQGAAGQLTGRLRLGWSPSANTNLVGYVIYWSTNWGMFDHSVVIGNVTNYTLQNVPVGVTNYHVVTALDVNSNQSPPSNIVTNYMVPPIVYPPAGLMVVSAVYPNETIFMLVPSTNAIPPQLPATVPPTPPVPSNP